MASFTHFRVCHPYPDAAAGAMQAEAPDYPGLAEFVAENVRTVPSDALALAAFAKS